MFKPLSAFFASLSLLVAGVAQAAPAQSLSLTSAPEIRRAATSPGASNNDVTAGAYVIGAVIAGLAIWGIVELATGDDDDPDSP